MSFGIEPQRPAGMFCHFRSRLSPAILGRVITGRVVGMKRIGDLQVNRFVVHRQLPVVFHLHSKKIFPTEHAAINAGLVGNDRNRNTAPMRSLHQMQRGACQFDIRWPMQIITVLHQDAVAIEKDVATVGATPISRSRTSNPCLVYVPDHLDRGTF